MKHGVCALLHWRWGKARSLFGIVFAQDHRGFDLQKIRCEAAGRGWQQCCLDGGAGSWGPWQWPEEAICYFPLKEQRAKAKSSVMVQAAQHTEEMLVGFSASFAPGPPSPPSPSLMVRPWPYEIQA